MQTQTPVESYAIRPAIWFGFDLSKVTFDEASRKMGLKPVDAEEIRNMKTREFKRTRKGIEQWWHKVNSEIEPGQKVGVVMEVTSYFSLETAVWLEELSPQIEVAIVSGKSAHSFADTIGMKNKTDEIDARVLAGFGTTHQPAPRPAVSELQTKIRALLRTRLVYVEQIEANRMRLDEAACEHLPADISKVIQKSLGQSIAHTQKLVDKIELEVKKLIDSDPQLKEDVKLLDTVKGVGLLTAATIYAELGDLRRFNRRTKLTSFAGLNPKIFKSGTSVDKRPRISKAGSCRARRALYLAAMATLKGDNEFNTAYRAMLAKGKRKMVAIVAIMRKILLTMRGVLCSGKAYDPNYRKGAVEKVSTAA